MLSFKDIVTLKNLYQNNENIIQYIKNNTSLNPEEAIMHSYDLQAGSYIQELADHDLNIHKKEVGLKLSALLKDLSVECVCEAGIGEATTLSQVLSNIDIKNNFGFDISMSRLLYAQEYLATNKLNANLFCAEICRIPFANDAIECIYTFHSLEPNGGKERQLLVELLRVTKNYLILIEPDYDLFSEDQKRRMDQHGYIKHLNSHLSELGANVIHYAPWECDSYELNKASITIIEKKNSKSTSDIRYASPISNHPLIPKDDGFFCKEDGFFFPRIKNIPVLLRKNAILISHFDSFE